MTRKILIGMFSKNFICFTLINAAKYSTAQEESTTAVCLRWTDTGIPVRGQGYGLRGQQTPEDESGRRRAAGHSGQAKTYVCLLSTMCYEIGLYSTLCYSLRLRHKHRDGTWSRRLRRGLHAGGVCFANIVRMRLFQEEPHDRKRAHCVT